MMIDSLKLQTLIGVSKKEMSKSVEGFKTSTPDHADYFNQALQQLIDNDMTLENQTNEAVRSLKLNQLDIAVELETLKGAVLTGVNANVMVQTFSDLEGTLIQGIYNNMEKKLIVK
ncbi:hypothetical protein R9X47_18155 [Wukongibacter baidiensis]|uniref:hypothetical protein n=1 Tax=Wukongibacter baidiensis TaxID=1723361 RepID=UPI003D7FDBA5